MAKDQEADLLAVFSGATQADLDAISARREELQKQLAGLEQIEKALRVKLNGKPERKTPVRKPAQPGAAGDGGGSLGLVERRRKVAAYIMANGNKSQQKLSEACAISKFGPNSLGTVIDCDLFHATPDGLVSLTAKGEKVALET